MSSMHAWHMCVQPDSTSFIVHYECIETNLLTSNCSTGFLVKGDMIPLMKICLFHDDQLKIQSRTLNNGVPMSCCTDASTYNEKSGQ